VAVFIQKHHPLALEISSRRSSLEGDFLLAETYCEEGNKYFSQGEWKKAVTAYSKGLLQNPSMERCRRRILYDFKAIEDLPPALTLAAAIEISESDDESDDSQA
jgi:hypothetical protein